MRGGLRSGFCTWKKVHLPYFTEEETEAHRGKAVVPKCSLQPENPPGCDHWRTPPATQVREGSPRKASGWQQARALPLRAPHWLAFPSGPCGFPSISDHSCLSLPVHLGLVPFPVPGCSHGWQLLANSLHQPVPSGPHCTILTAAQVVGER